MMPKGENGLILMLKLDKKKHLVGHHQRVGRLERGKEKIFVSRKGQGEVTPMSLRANKTKLQVATAIGLSSSQSPNGNKEIIKETEVTNRLAATKEQEAVCSSRHKIGGAEHPCTLLVQRSVKVQRQHDRG
uniref:Uncharacterized protein n=1 Tax=Arundo donax TaxID=35708 RepID=A0A0A9GG38_ARUDO